MEVSAKTIRSWVRRYRREGLEGLKDKARARRGLQALTAEQVEMVCDLKRDEIDGDSMKGLIQPHPLFQASIGGGR